MTPNGLDSGSLFAWGLVLRLFTLTIILAVLALAYHLFPSLPQLLIPLTLCIWFVATAIWMWRTLDD